MNSISKFKIEIIISWIQILCMLGIALLLPFLPKYTPWLITGLVTFFLLEGHFKEKWNLWKKNKFLWLIITFYILHLFGMLNTSNTESGFFDLQIKLPLLLLPFILSAPNEFVKKKSNFVVYAFIIGNLIASVYCLHQAYHVATKYVEKGSWITWDYMQYDFLSVLLHPSYFSLYIFLCLCFIVHFLFRTKTNIFQKIVLGIVGLFFIAMTYLLSSRAGTISFVFAAFIFILSIRGRSVKILVLKFGLIVLTVFLITYVVKNNYRFNFISQLMNASNFKEDLKTTNLRVPIWYSSTNVIKRNFIAGVGIGDVHQELNEEYINNCYDVAFKANLNAHNQFLESMIAIGFFGGVILILIFYGIFKFALRKKNKILFYLTITVFINFLFESMLNLQIGVIFISFFLPFIAFILKDSELEKINQ
ncbi:MAG: O-antigen ligase family protein [Bacteroidota bacterium]